MAADFVIVLTTFPVDYDIATVASTLVEERLAACVNVLPAMQSIYAWKGVVERADERQVIIKTTALRVRELEPRLKALHPYDLPEFLVVSVTDGSRDYLSWLSTNTSES